MLQVSQVFKPARTVVPRSAFALRWSLTRCSSDAAPLGCQQVENSRACCPILQRSEIEGDISCHVMDCTPPKIAPLLTRGNVALSPITSLTSLGTAPWRAAFYYHNIRSPSRRTCDTYWVVEYRWSVLPNQVLILFHPTSHCLFPVLGLQKQSGWCGLRLRVTRGGFSWSALSDLVPFSVAGWKRFQFFHSWVPTSNKIDLARRNLQTPAEIAIWFVWIIIMAIFLDKNVGFFPQKHGTDIAETYQTMLSVQQMEFLEDLWRPGKWRVLRENSPKFPWNLKPVFLAKKLDTWLAIQSLPLPWAQNRSIGLEVVIFVLPACRTASWSATSPPVPAELSRFLPTLQSSNHPSTGLLQPSGVQTPPNQPGGDALLCLFGPQLLSERSRDRWNRWVLKGLKKHEKH